jgi:hypothetical protein
MTGIRSRGERGQALPALALLVSALVMFTLVVIVPMGSAADRRAEARTGADAAALAALRAVVEDLDGLDALLPPGLGGTVAEGQALEQTLDLMGSRSQAAAAEYAVRNDTNLVDFDIDISLAARRPMIQAYAATRSQQDIVDTNQRANAQARAQLRVADGLCGVGGGWGLELSDGSCRSLADLLIEPPPPLPDPPPPPDPPDPPEPPLEWEPIRLDDALLID